MPRTPIDLGFGIDRLSALDEDGSLDASLDPKVPDDDLRRLYRTMALARAYDERRLKLQRQGRIGTFAPCTGQEAAQAGSAYCLEPADWVVPSFRETAVAILRGMRLEDDLLYCAGFEEGIRIPGDARDLPLCIPVASQVPHAVGLAWGLRLQGSDRVVLCCFGDGATSEGDFHEGLNFASLRQVPVVLFCQNNQWAISVPRSEQSHSRTLAQKGLAYDIPSLVVDGNDLLAVIVATREAVARARQGRGPTLIEAVTYRMGPHTTADDPTLYRSAGEVEAWARRDPLARLRLHLARRGLLTEAEEQEWSDEAHAAIQAAVALFEERAGHADPLAMFDHLYARMPGTLVAQLRELEGRVARRAASRKEAGGEESKEEGKGKESGQERKGAEGRPRAPRERSAPAPRDGEPEPEASPPRQGAEESSGRAGGSA